MNEEDYKLIPTEVLDRIQDITEQEQSRIDSQVSYAEAQLNAMRNQAKHNKRVLILYTSSIITQCMFIGIVLFK